MIEFQFLIQECFCFLHHSGLYTMQEPSYLGKVTLVSVWYWPKQQLEYAKILSSCEPTKNQ